MQRVKVSNCVHVNTVSADLCWDQLKLKQNVEECDSCPATSPHLWCCLYKDCHYIGCGENAEDHSLKHFEEKNHNLTVNLMTLRIWCNKCEIEVFPDNNNPPFIIHGNRQLSPHHTGKSDISNESSPHRSVSTYEDSDSDYEDETIKPRGLTGLQNLGNTCYMNSALQALSNCPPLTRFFLDCAGYVRPDKTPHLSKHYLRLVLELWHKKRPSYVVPTGVVNGIKVVHPMFRGCTQQDTQEFLRCFMDQLHEELKQPIIEEDDDDDDDQIEEETSAEYPVPQIVHDRKSSIDSASSQSDGEYETCDSGLSSERNSGDHNFSEDEGSDGNDQSGGRSNNQGRDRNRHNARSMYDNNDTIPNIKDNKETTNLLAKSPERRHRLSKSESGEFADAVSDLGSSTTYSLRSRVSSSVKHAAPSSDKNTPTVNIHQKSTTNKTTANKKNKKNIHYKSIISETFDGRILSSVQCLTCERISTTKETFQDLSLPIPSRDHLQLLHSSQSGLSGAVVPKGGSCGEVNPGWITWVLTWMKSFFTGPTISLQDCLAAFFSADELKGDNMYSCEKCKKLRNGLKFSKVLELPEILCIHLKRFRHEFYSSKIGAYVAFPLDGLDMKHYLHKDCKNEITIYDLTAVICHHGTAGGGHYTAYCLNYINERWYEFDDQVVTEVDIQQVINCEAYVLFYRKRNDQMHSLRQKAMELMEAKEPSLMQFFVSKQWINRFNTLAEPGRMTNSDFLCTHGGVPPYLVDHVDNLVVPLNQCMWEYLYNRYGGGPVCNRLYSCQICQRELDTLRLRQKTEMETFIQLNEEFKCEENPNVIYAISMVWFKEWENFVRDRTPYPPGPIENNRIAIMKNGQQVLKQTSDHGQVSRETWCYLYKIYGGGPELTVKQTIQPTTLLSQATSNQTSPGQPTTVSQQKTSTATNPSPTANSTEGNSESSSSSQTTVVEGNCATPVNNSSEEELPCDGQPSDGQPSSSGGQPSFSGGQPSSSGGQPSSSGGQPSSQSTVADQSTHCKND